MLVIDSLVNKESTHVGPSCHSKDWIDAGDSVRVEFNIIELRYAVSVTNML